MATIRRLMAALNDPWVWGQLVLLLLVAVGAPLLAALNLGPLDPLLGQMDPRWLRHLGLVVATAGLVVGIFGALALGRNLTPATKPVDDGRLIQSGIYARIRHPIYTGVILVVAGYMLWWTNWRDALLVGWLTMLYFGAKSGAEERKLLAKFPDYENYRRRVPRFFPF
ncbi:MAG: isoprenylcysteine carboxylmethyltransferase family protein [Gemmatimonadota bacterium]